MTAKSMIRNVLAPTLAFLILFAPAYKQILGERNDFVPAWRMFSGTGTGIIALRFEASSRGGKRVPIPAEDVFPSLKNLAPGQRVPVKRVQRESEVRAITWMLCRKLGPEAEVFVFARQAKRTGWHRLDSGKKNRCAPAAKESRRNQSSKTHRGAKND